MMNVFHKKNHTLYRLCLSVFAVIIIAFSLTVSSCDPESPVSILNVSFDPNGGSGEMRDISVLNGGSLVLPKATFTKENYIFAGWNTQLDGRGQKFLDGQPINLNSLSEQSLNRINFSGNRLVLYAQWTGAKHKITFDPNGGELDEELLSMDVSFGSIYGLEQDFPIPEREGFTFAGWFTEPDEGDLVTEDDTVKGTEDIELYAHWKVSFTLSLSSNITNYVKNASNDALKESLSNVEAPETISLSFGEEYGELPELSAPGWVFEGWFPRDIGGGKIVSTDIVDGRYNILYAHWREGVYSLSIVGGEGISSFLPAVSPGLRYGDVVPISATLVPGKIFDSWTSNVPIEPPFGFEDKTAASTNFTMPGSSVTLTPRTSGNAYIISFDVNKTEANGSTPSLRNAEVSEYPESRTIGSGRAYGELPVLSCTGWTFDGWYTERVGGVKVSADTVITSSKDHTLYAHWTETKYTVTLARDENILTSTASKTTNLVYGEIISLSAVAKRGYTFKAWSATKAPDPTLEEGTPITVLGFDNELDSGTRFTMPDSNIIITANSKAQVYSLFFDLNGGLEFTPIPSYVDVPYDQEIILPDNNAVVRQGYTLRSWNTRQDGLGATYEVGATVKSLSLNDPLTLYAQWTANIYTVRFNANNGSGSMTPLNMIYNMSRTLPLNSFSNMGFVFNSWNTKADGTGYSYSNGETVINLSNVDGDVVDLYAQWSAQLEVSFIANKTTGSTSELTNSNITNMPSSITVLSGDKYKLPTTVPEREGWTFDGWYTRPSEGTKVTNETVVVDTFSHSLYAHWVENEYTLTITCGPNVNSIRGETITAKFGELVRTPITAKCIAAGYKFSKWVITGASISVISNVNNQTTEISMSMPSNDVVVTATVYKASYKLMVYGNGATSHSDNTPVTVGYTYKENSSGLFNKFTRIGYVLGGFNTKKDGSGTSYGDSEGRIDYSELPPSDTTIYCQWIPNTYTVIFNANDGSGRTDSLTLRYDEERELHIDTTSINGYAFAGWNTEVNGSGTNYLDGQKIKSLTPVDNGVVNLYAQWTSSVIVSFNENKTSGSTDLLTNSVISNMPSSIAIEYNTNYVLPSNIPVREGWEFSGWYTSAVGGTKVTNDLVVTLNSTHILYAHWTEKEYTLTIDRSDPNISSITSSKVKAKYGENISIVASVKSGYKFNKWTANSGRIVSENSSITSFIMPATDATLTATASPISYTVLFYGNGATSTNGNVVFGATYGSEFNLPMNVFVKEGYTFIGWNTEVDGSGTSYADKSRVSNLSSVDGSAVYLYAQWIPNKYRVIYNGNGNTSGFTANSLFTYGIYENLNSNAFIKTGYTFKNWNTEVNGSGQTYNDNASVYNLTSVSDGIVNLYAQWTAITYNIRYNGNTSTGGNTSSTQAEYDKNVELTRNGFVKVGYTFKDWNTKPDGSGNSYANESNVINLANVNGSFVDLYAQWTANTYIITYNGNGSTSGFTTDTVATYDQPINLAENGFFRTGFRFRNWNTIANGTGVGYSNKELVSNLASNNNDVLVLYAQWDELYTLALSLGSSSVLSVSSLTGATTTALAGDIIPISVVVNEGYQFNSWTTNKAGFKVDEPYKSSTTVTMPASDLMVYASISVIPYSISYTLNGGSATNPTSYNVETETFRLINPTRRGYSFKGWSGTDLVSGTPNTNVSINKGSTGNKYYVANWTALTYLLTFDSNRTSNGSTQVLRDSQIVLSKTSKEITFGSSYGDLPTPTRTGWTFEGWYTEATGGTLITNTTIVDMAYSHTLYAHWSETEYILSIVKGKGIESVTPSTDRALKYGERINLIAVLESGKYFKSWSTDIAISSPFGIESELSETTGFIMPASNVVLYPKTDNDAFVLSFNVNKTSSNGSTNALKNSPVSEYPDDRMIIFMRTYGELPKLSSVGWTFKGWFTQPTGGVEVTKDTVLSDRSNKTIYAHWEETDYTLHVASGTNVISVSGGPITAKYGASISANISATLFATGYQFDKWTVSGISANSVANLNNSSTSVSFVMPDNNVTITANAKNVVYTLNVYGNGATSHNETTAVTKTFTYKQNASYTFSEFRKTGYHLIGLNTQVGGTGTSYGNSSGTVNFSALPASNVTLYCQWSPNTYTVMFNSNDGSGNTTSQVITYDSTTALISNPFSRTGYVFVSWNTMSNGSGVTYTSNQSVKNLISVNNGSIVLYAQWQNKFTVSFNANNISGSNATLTDSVASNVPANITVTYQSKYNLPSSTPTRTGWTFDGWYTLPNGGTRVTSSTFVTTGSNHTLYAHWVEANYTLFVASGTNVISVSGGPVSAKYGENISANINATAFATGYQFDKWTVSDINISSIADPNSASTSVSFVMPAKNVTITANAKNLVYTLTVYGNGATSHNDSASISKTFTYKQNASYTFSEFAKTGYHITGLNTQINGTGMSYGNASGTVNYSALPASDVTLYCQWVANTYRVNFNSNDGSSTTSTQTLTFDAATMLNSNTFVRNGYAFTSWNTKADGSGTSYANNQRVRNLTTTNNGSITLYAQWARLVSVSFNGNKTNGSTNALTNSEVNNVPSSISVINGSKYELPSSIPTRTGWVFEGWYTDKNNGTLVTNDTTVTQTTAHTLYAHWSEAKYTLTIIKGEGVQLVNPELRENLKYGDVVAVRAVLESGKYFKSWSSNITVSAPFGFENISSESTNFVMPASNVVLYQITDNNIFVLSFDTNSTSLISGSTQALKSSVISSNPDNKMIIYMQPYGDLPLLSCAGWTFNGWYTEVNGGDLITKDSLVSLPANHTLYAHWSEASYSLTVNKADANITTVTGGKNNAKYGETITIKATPAKGYIFNRWSYTAGTIENVFSAETKLTMPYENVTVTASVIPVTYSIAFNGNNPTFGSMSNIIARYNESVTLPANSYTKTGYMFKNWNIKQDGSSTSYSDKASVSNLAAVNDYLVTLYAQWTPITYTLVLNGNGATNGLREVTLTYNVPYTLTSDFEKSGYVLTQWNTRLDGSGISYSNGASLINLTETQGTRIYLYAMWSNAYNLTLAALPNTIPSNAVTFTGAKSNAIEGEIIPISVTTNPAYTFSYWTTNISSYNVNEPSNSSTTLVMPASDLTVIANIIPTEYEISYDLNGGVIASSNPTSYTVLSDKITLREPTRMGYEFRGWTGTGLSVVTKTVVIEKGSTGDRSYTANWNAVTYNITYTLNNGTNNSSNPKTYNIETADIVLRDPTRLGYAFTGWTGSNGSNPQKNVIIPKGSMGHRYYTANWYLDTFSINYNLGGGTVSEVNPTNYNINNEFTLNNPTRKGYTFVGWSGTDLQGIENLTVKIQAGSSGNREYKANWSPISYTILYILNEGTNDSSNPASYTIESDEIVLKDPTKTGYNFTGWTGSNGTTAQKGVRISNGSMGARSYIANWTPISYTFTYLLSNGTNDPSNPSSYTIESAEITLKDATRAGYTFTGWTGSNGSTPQKNVKIPSGTTGNKSYIANWNAITYSIKYNLNGGTNDSSNPSSYTIESANISLKQPTKTGYLFTGWSGTGLEGTSNKNVVINTGSLGNRNYTANWEPITYYIRFNGNDSTDGSMSNQSVQYNTSVNLTANSFVRAGYTFSGWALTSSGNVVYQDGQSISNLSANNGSVIDLFAKWTANSYVITFNSNGGSGTMSNISAIYDTPVTLPQNKFTKLASTFRGWTTSSDGEVVMFRDKDTVINLTSVNNGVAVLYALWDAEYFDFNSYGEIIINPDLSVPMPKTITIPSMIKGTSIDTTSVEFFLDNNEIESVIFESGYTTIGEVNFVSCDLLESVVLPNTLEIISLASFAYCESLKEIVLPESLKVIEASAFRECTSLSGSITIPSGVTKIGDYAFSGCTNLEYIYFNGTLSEFLAIERGTNCFSGCRAKTIICTDSTISISRI